MDLRLRAFLAAMRAREGDPRRETAAQRAATRTDRPAWLAAAVLGAPARSVQRRDTVVGTPRRAVPVRVYRPRPRPGLTAGPLPLVLNAHGGGWVHGTLQNNDWMCSHLADRLGALVVSVDYRMAPEHPAPAAVDDCWAVLAALMTRGGAPLTGGEPFVVDPTRAAVLGDSAGGNIAALLAVRHRDALRGGGSGAPPAPLRHQVLLYPAVDLTLASPSIAARPRAPMLGSAQIHGFRDLYLGDTGIAPADPRVSPLHAPDHTDVAPALVVTTDLDPLEDDGVRYARALRKAGVPVRYTCYTGVPHGFLSVPGPARLAHQGLAEVVQELRAALA